MAGKASGLAKLQSPENPVTKTGFDRAKNKRSLRKERKRMPPGFVSVKSSRSLVDAETPEGERNNHTRHSQTSDFFKAVPRMFRIR